MRHADSLMDYEQEAVHDSHTKHAVRERDEARQRLSDLATAVRLKLELVPPNASPDALGFADAIEEILSEAGYGPSPPLEGAEPDED